MWRPRPPDHPSLRDLVISDRTVCRIFMQIGTVIYTKLPSKREFSENSFSDGLTLHKNVNIAISGLSARLD